MNSRTTSDHSSYITITPQYAEGNHCNAINVELLRYGNATCFCFQSFVFKVPLLPSD